ncbi:MAG: GAF domain-containing protein [Gemmatimonadaceae bacterium]|nr:GAF domain-containing protein [Gemmatimonadaceae bacterium]
MTAPAPALAIPLERLTACFQGLIPAWLFTCAADGTPNAAILSHVDYVDARHVALSFQFFNKSKRNVSENPQAAVRLVDAESGQVYQLALRLVRTETSGPLFESMRLRIEAIASYSGLKGVFRLLGADVYEVLSVEALEHEPGYPAAVRRDTPAEPKFTMRAMQEVSECLRQAQSLDALLDTLLETIERIFGFGHSMILLGADEPDRLTLVASRGYPEGGVGSEVGFGEGIVGLVAEARRPVRVSGMLRYMVYADAVARRSLAMGMPLPTSRIPLPGLPNPDSQLGVPLLARDELLGVLCIESDLPYRFHEEDRANLELLGGFVALAIQNALLLERAETRAGEAEAARAIAPTTPSTPTTPAAPIPDDARATRRAPMVAEFFTHEECVLVDGEYLVRSLPARILWKLLTEHEQDGTREFTNRRLRLDKSLALPPVKDNLETRLILLRRRLAERCPGIQMIPAGRGRFRLEVTAALSLVRRP